MSETPAADPAVDAETDEYVQSFVDAIERRFPTASSSTDEPDQQPAEDQPAEEPETTPPVPAETPTGPAQEPDEGGTPAEGEPPDARDGQPAPAFTLAGTEYTEQQIAQALPVYDWFTRLTPDQVQAVDALLSGQYRLEPAQPQPTQASTPSPSPPATAPDDEGDWLDPKAQQEIQALRSQINELQQNFTANLRPVVETQQQADYQQRLAAINQAHATFQQNYNLSDEAMQTLETTIAETQVLPALAHRHGSLQAGMNAALEMAFWTTPTYRDPYLQQRTDSQQAEQAQENAATVRKQHLTALSGSGGSVPRREPVPATQEDRHAAMTAEIAQAWNGSGQVQ